MMATSAAERWWWSSATSPVSPPRVFRGAWLTVSQMLGVRPPCATAPAIW